MKTFLKAAIMLAVVACDIGTTSTNLNKQSIITRKIYPKYGPAKSLTKRHVVNMLVT